MLEPVEPIYCFDQNNFIQYHKKKDNRRFSGKIINELRKF